MKNNRAEGVVQVLILILVAGMAGAASFTHVHNWTMDNAPAGTGSWFGWANAVISELTPTAAGIEIRRRRRKDPHAPIAYPMAILIAAAALSLSAQVAEARPTVGGWISSAVPALAFLALTKLVLSRSGHTPVKEDPECVTSATTPAARATPAPTTDAPEPSRPSSTMLRPAPATATPTMSVAVTENGSSSPAAPALTASPTDYSLQPVSSAQLLGSARLAAFAHRQATGQTITPAELAGRLGVPLVLAESLTDHIGGTPPPVTAVNGTALSGGSRP